MLIEKKKSLTQQISKSIETALDGLLRTSIARSTIFPACLMLNCLAEASMSAVKSKVMLTLSDFILDEKNVSWSWNYISRASRETGSKKYPDDLDDTACALIALQRLGQLEITPEILACFAQHLIQSEIKEGGPYRTWIGNFSDGAYGDIDIAVNANIGYFLGMHGIFLDNLDSFIAEAIAKDSFVSLYYDSKPIIAYFIARYVAIHPHREKFGEINLGMNPSDETKNSLEVALAVVSTIRFGLNIDLEHYIIQILESQGADGLWSACPVYIDEITDGKIRYCESPELTTAFCVEALSLYANRKSPEATDATKNTLEAIRNELKRLFPSRDEIDMFLGTDMEKFIALLPFYFNRALSGKNIVKNSIDESADKPTIVDLGVANMLGWIGYTIQDDIIDKETAPDVLPFSNLCIRESQRLFESKTLDSRYKTYVIDTFNKIDKANILETSSKGAETSLETIAHKSFGHALGPLAICTNLGHGPESVIFGAIESFFRHFIIARQMSDDAHDWEDDLKRGYFNSASVMMPELILDDPEQTRKIFWNKTIDKISRKIHYHLELARNHGKKCSGFVDFTYLNSLLAPIERSATRAVTERNKAVNFVEKFIR